MRYLITTTALLGAMALASPASAGTHEKAKEQGEQTKIQETGTSGQQAFQKGALEGTLQGTVDKIDEGKGELILREARAELRGGEEAAGQAQPVEGELATEDPQRAKLQAEFEKQTVTVYGTPSQVAQYEKGASVSLPFATYEGQIWLNDQDAGAPAEAGAQQGGEREVSGMISKVDLGHGELSLSEAGEETELRVHPRELERFTPGQFVNATVRKVKGETWIQSLNAPADTGVQQPKASPEMDPGAQQPEASPDMDPGAQQPEASPDMDPEAQEPEASPGEEAEVPAEQ